MKYYYELDLDVGVLRLLQTYNNISINPIKFMEHIKTLFSNYLQLIKNTFKWFK